MKEHFHPTEFIKTLHATLYPYLFVHFFTAKSSRRHDDTLEIVSLLTGEKVVVMVIADWLLCYTGCTWSKYTPPLHQSRYDWFYEHKKELLLPQHALNENLAFPTILFLSEKQYTICEGCAAKNNIPPHQHHHPKNQTSVHRDSAQLCHIFKCTATNPSGCTHKPSSHHWKNHPH